MKNLKNCSPQPRRTIFLVVAMLLLTVFLMNFIGATKVIHEDNKANVHEDLQDKFNDKYGVEKVTDTILWIIPDKKVEYSLISNTEQCLTECEAYGEAVLYKNTKIFDKANFKDAKKNLKTLTYQFL